MRLRIYYRWGGVHVHCRVFSDGALSGTLVFRAEEWPDVAVLLDKVADLIPDDGVLG